MAPLDRLGTAILLALAALLRLAGSQAGSHAGDVLHRIERVEVSADGASREWRADFEGFLHVWARAEGAPVRLRIEFEGRREALEAEGSRGGGLGGGGAAWIVAQVQPGMGLAIDLAAGGPGEDGTWAVELHGVSAPESEATREALEAVRAGLEEVERLRQAGQHAEARERVAIMIETLLAAPGAQTSEHVAQGAFQAGLAAHQLGDLAGAARAWGQAHAHRERVLPPDHPHLSGTRSNLALVLRDLGDLRRARELQEQVLAARARTLPPEHPELLDAQGNLAGTLQMLGELEAALALRRAVLEARSRALPQDHPQLLEAQEALGAALYEGGDREPGRALLERVHEALARLLPPDHPRLVRTRLNLAAMRGELGDREGARELEEQALAVLERLLPPEHPMRVGATANLAATRLALGDLAGARELQERVLAVRERLLPPDHPALLAAKLNLSSILRSAGDAQSALELLEQVHGVQRRTLPPEHPDRLRVQENLAMTLILMGREEEARDHLVEIHRARAERLPVGHPLLADSQQNLAALSRMRGDLESAAALTREFVAGSRARALELSAESNRLARLGLVLELRRLATALSWTASGEPDPGLEEELFALLEGLRLVSTRSAAASRAAARYPELAELRQRWAASRGELHDRALAPPPADVDPEAWRRELIELAGRRDRLEHELHAALAERGSSLALPTAPAVAARLAPGSALVSYLRHPVRADPRAGLLPDAAPPERWTAFVLEPVGRVRRLDLGAAEEIEAHVASWRAALGVSAAARAPGIGVEDPGASELLEHGRALRAALVDPVLELLDGLRVLHVVPDDVLYLLPFEALPDGEGVLGDRLALRIEPTLARWVDEALAPRGEPRLVALGGVDYWAEPGEDGAPERAGGAPIFEPPPVQAAPLKRGAAAAPFAALPASRREAESVAGTFLEVFGREPELLLDERADKARLLEALPGARFVHIATHGWFASESGAPSLLDAPQGAVTTDRSRETLAGFLPETLCGLALAGANRGPSPDGRVRGILTAEELGALDLSACELAVLSACETHVGLRRAGQGIQSLQTSLHAAGARSAITSLWKVDDAATRAFFEHFYAALWKEGLSRSDALWRAKTLLRDAGHPARDWAAWILTGDPD